MENGKLKMENEYTLQMVILHFQFSTLHLKNYSCAYSRFASKHGQAFRMFSLSW